MCSSCLAQFPVLAPVVPYDTVGLWKMNQTSRNADSPCHGPKPTSTCQGGTLAHPFFNIYHFSKTLSCFVPPTNQPPGNTECTQRKFSQ
jgi:hypothetical protein